MKLALGTVQFGLNYGATNKSGKVSLEDAETILDIAYDAGIAWLDTAAGYGDSEAVLGQLLTRRSFQICTKTCALPMPKLDEAALETVGSGFKQSLERLKQTHVELLMVHHAGDLLKAGADRLYGLLQGLKAEGLVKRIGFSAYDGEEISQITSRFAFDALQVPTSILDQRVVASGLLQRLSDHGMTIFVRSVFLQGRLLSRPLDGEAAQDLQRYWHYVDKHGLEPLSATLGFVKALKCVDYAVVGVTSPDELTQIVRAYQTTAGVIAPELASQDLNLLDPRRWT